MQIYAVDLGGGGSLVEDRYTNLLLTQLTFPYLKLRSIVLSLSLSLSLSLCDVRWGECVCGGGGGELEGMGGQQLTHATLSVEVLMIAS